MNKDLEKEFDEKFQDVYELFEIEDDEGKRWLEKSVTNTIKSFIDTHFVAVEEVQDLVIKTIRKDYIPKKTIMDEIEKYQIPEGAETHPKWAKHITNMIVQDLKEKLL